MGGPPEIERRDPASGILNLGVIFSQAREARTSGQIEISDSGSTYAVDVSRGAVSNISCDGVNVSFSSDTQARLGRQLEHLFTLPRPYARWVPRRSVKRASRQLDPGSVVLKGVTRRRDLFHPRQVVERIPVETLSLDKPALKLCQNISFNQAERAFLAELSRPTPISLILWKRGLKPEYASALLIALNLLGLFRDQWVPGDLPRNKTAACLRRRLNSKLSDHEILGVSSEASLREVDRAFRKISFDIHPDRFTGCSQAELEGAKSAFIATCEAYHRIKQSLRRSIPRSENNPPSEQHAHWRSLFSEILKALERGQDARARAFAVKALASSPPAGLKERLLHILKNAA